ncbi:TIGR02391 family protein [Nocardia sp. XZ_19_231]|uniref:TIGR02391 family protein n=1 Tax=Nocardia sp. XZ_19_231 TaxID=2769252 RepID=UPI0018908963|nr:TIGR02391 family protein [Nocardia sp. XZ_19_231]
MYQPIIAWEDIRHLPLPDLAIKLLVAQTNNSAPNLHSTLRGLEAALRDAPQRDGNELMARIADAWAWLEAHALLAKHPVQYQVQGNWQRVTERGRELVDDPKAIAKVWADDRLAGPLSPLLDSARSNFAMGDYETASFAAMKAVEVEVRRVAELPNELLGVNLMRKAFSPKDGLLRDPAAEGGEQQATADLFAGAIGAFKNPASHRTVRFDDPFEAAEILQLADLLLRIVRRAERRTQTKK